MSLSICRLSKAILQKGKLLATSNHLMDSAQRIATRVRPFSDNLVEVDCSLCAADLLRTKAMKIEPVADEPSGRFGYY